jgi:hypothetical protein
LVQNSATGDRETVTLTETTVNSGIFTGSLPSSITNGGDVEDGTLKALAGDTVAVSHTDSLYSDTCSDSAQLSVPSLTKPLYLSTDGSGSPDQDLDRNHPGETGDSTTAATSALSSGSGAVAVDATTKNVSTSASSLTFAHTTGTGSNRLMLVAVVVGASASTGNNAGTVSSVTYGGTSLTQVGVVTFIAYSTRLSAATALWLRWRQPDPSMPVLRPLQAWIKQRR